LYEAILAYMLAEPYLKALVFLLSKYTGIVITERTIIYWLKGIWYPLGTCQPSDIMNTRTF